MRDFEVLVQEQGTLCAQCGRNSSDGAAGSAAAGSGSVGSKDLAIAKQHLEVSKTMLANKDARCKRDLV